MKKKNILLFVYEIILIHDWFEGSWSQRLNIVIYILNYEIANEENNVSMIGLCKLKKIQSFVWNWTINGAFSFMFHNRLRIKVDLWVRCSKQLRVSRKGFVQQFDLTRITHLQKNTRNLFILFDHSHQIA